MKRPLPTIVGCLCLIIAACEKNNDPEIPDFPQISFLDVHTANGENADEVILTVGFSDGDFDLGLSHEHVLFPYHPYDFFTVMNGTTATVSANYIESPNGGEYVMLTPEQNQAGSLATYKRVTEELANPVPFSCINYFYTHPILLRASDRRLIDGNIQIIDSVSVQQEKVYFLKDTFLYETNKNHFNISVDYLVEDNGSYSEFDFFQEFCIASFDGRFPLLDGMQAGADITHGPFTIKVTSSRQGELTYVMRSVGFKILFGTRNIKLRVSIRDRSLNESNVIETPPFKMVE
jgi:hypothetical protein